MSTNHINKLRVISISEQDKGDYLYSASRKRKAMIRKACMTEGREFYGNISKNKLSRSGLYDPTKEISFLKVRRISEMTPEEKKELGL